MVSTLSVAFRDGSAAVHSMLCACGGLVPGGAGDRRYSCWRAAGQAGCRRLEIRAGGVVEA
jgi:hypothetical protein